MRAGFCALAAILFFFPAVCCALFATGLKHAGGEAEVRKTFTTFGSRSCADWVRDMEDAKSIGDDFARGIAYQSDQAWLAGYVSGVNATLTRRADLLSGMDLQTASDWVDEFCKENKSSDVIDAVGELYVRLLKMNL